MMLKWMVSNTNFNGLTKLFKFLIEWMYELKERGEKTKWDRYILGCQYFHNEDYKEALEFFEDYETIFEERYGRSDLPTLNLMAKCKLHL